MGTRVMLHVRRQGVAYLALFIALGSSGYAATNLARNTVGSKAIKRGAVLTRHLSFPLASAGAVLSDPLSLEPGGTQSLASATIRHRSGSGMLLTSGSVVVTNTGPANALVTLSVVIDGKVQPAAIVQVPRNATQTVPNFAVNPCQRTGTHPLELQASVEGGPVSIGSRTLAAQLLPAS